MLVGHSAVPRNRVAGTRDRIVDRAPHSYAIGDSYEERHRLARDLESSDRRRSVDAARMEHGL